MVLALAAGLVLGGAPLHTIWVAVPPDVAPCTVDVFAAAFRSRLGQIIVLPGVRDLTASEIQVVIRPTEEGLELRVYAAAERELIRDLPGPGANCLAASETAALMIERYLDEVGVGVAVAAGVPLVPLAPLAPPMRWRFTLEGMANAELAVLPQLAPGESTTIPAVGVGGSIAIGVRRGHWLQLSARGSWEPSGSTVVAGSAANGNLNLQAVALSLAGTYLLGVGPGAVRFEIAPGAQLFWADTSTSSGGQFGRTFSTFSALPFIGVGVGYEVPVWEHLSLVAGASMRVHLGTRWLEVEGVMDDTAYTRQLDGEASLGLGYVFY